MRTDLSDSSSGYPSLKPHAPLDHDPLPERSGSRGCVTPLDHKQAKATLDVLHKAQNASGHLSALFAEIQSYKSGKAIGSKKALDRLTIEG